MENTHKNTVWYEMLHGKIADDILTLSIGQTGISYWENVEEKTIKYLIKNCLEYPWINFLALHVLFRTYMKYDDYTIRQYTMVLNKKLRELFEVFDIDAVEQWNPDKHLALYAERKVLTEHSSRQRNYFITTYSTSVAHVHHWINNSFRKIVADKLHTYNFPLVVEKKGKSAVPLYKEIREETTRLRKDETEAILPYFPQIRGEAHLRWNKLNRLQNKYNEVLKTITPSTPLPVEFSYFDNNGSDKAYREKFYCRIWNKKSFAKQRLNQEYITGNEADDTEYFLEFVRSERFVGDDAKQTDGLWFFDLLQHGALGFSNRKKNEARKVKEFLLGWGYGNVKKEDSFPTPFNAPLLYSGVFLQDNQNYAEGTLFNIKDLFIAATFGLAALEIFTTTGARMNELLQISNTKECINVLGLNKSDNHNIRYILRMVPKGRTELENYFVGSESIKLLHKIKKILASTYGEVPLIKYSGDRAARFPEQKPYLFQWNNRLLNKAFVTAYLRFLTHGLVFTRKDGKQVSMKSHLLRHAFATHSVHVEKMPVDLIARVLHQKNIEVTKYYSSPTENMIAETVASWLETAATHVNIGEAIKRSPMELQELYHEAKMKIGALNEVTGGVCSTDALCPAKFSCVGCAAKIPEPAKKDQLIKTRTWAEESKQHFLTNGQPLEARKMEQLIVECDKELEEIRWIELYSSDEDYEPDLL